MNIGVKVVKNDVTQLIISVRKTRNDGNRVDIVTEKVDSRSEETSSEENDLGF